MEYMEYIWNLTLWQLLSKTGCQRCSAWFSRGPMLGCLCSVMSLWRNIQMLQTRLLGFSVVPIE